MLAYSRYAYDPRVRREAETLVRAGHRVSVVCTREGEEVPKEVINDVAVIRLPLSVRRGTPLRYLFQYVTFLLMCMAALRSIGRRQRILTVHVHSPPDFLIYAALGARTMGARLILDLHEAFPELLAARFPGRVMSYRLALLAQKAGCLLADRVFVVNETIRDLLLGRGVPADRVTVLYNSPDVSSAQLLPPPELREPGARGLRLVYAGGVNRERDLETLLRAVAKLREHQFVSLAVYGPGPEEYRSRLVELSDALELGDVVQFGGVLPPDRVLSCIAGTDVGIITYERNPNTEVALSSRAFEYVALDKPLVLPDLRTMRLVFQNSALFYEPGNATDLASKIEFAASNDDAIRSIRERARAVYESARWEVQAGRLIAAHSKSNRNPPGAGEGLCT